MPRFQTEYSSKCVKLLGHHPVKANGDSASSLVS